MTTIKFMTAVMQTNYKKMGQKSLICPHKGRLQGAASRKEAMTNQAGGNTILP